MQKPLILSHLSLLDHGVPSHIENASRLNAVFGALDTIDLSVNRMATPAELSEVHGLPYIQYVLSLQGKEAILDPDTLLTPPSVKAALLAAGLGLELVERVVEGKAQNGFALLRPPGHHARPGAGMGFCLFNNIAIAAKKALSLGLKRVLILDWDVHHGNGTQEMFYEEDRVLFIDLHQDNFFPSNSGLLGERGSGKGLGFTVNIPLPPGCRDAEYLYAFDKLVKPLAIQYQPELILVSAGFDAHETDPLGFMGITTQGFSELTKRVKALADELCDGKLVLFLEGGYDPFYLAKNVKACIDALEMESPAYTPIETCFLEVKNLIQSICESHEKRTT